MCTELSNTASTLLRDVGKQYNTLCSVITNVVSTEPNHPISTVYYFFARQVRYLKNEVLPGCEKHLPEFISSIARNSFWVVPCLAFSMGETDAFIDSMSTIAASWLYSNYDTRTLAEHAAIFGFVTGALRVTIATITCVATRNPAFAVSAAFGMANLVKRGLIIQGKDLPASK
jgi:hypothetical protein